VQLPYKGKGKDLLLPSLPGKKIIFIFQITMFHKMCQDYKVGMTPFVMPKLAIIISNSRTTNIN
jgi:hypothetical protein